MTTVHVDLRRPQRDTTDRQPVTGTLDVSLYRRQREGNRFVLVTAFAQVLVDGQATLQLTPTDGTNGWTVVERVRDGKTRIVGVPDSSSTVEYVDLPDLTGSDLTPTFGNPTATATQWRGPWQANTAYPPYTFTSNGGGLYFTDLPVPARTVFTASDWKGGTGTGGGSGGGGGSAPVDQGDGYYDISGSNVADQGDGYYSVT